MKPGINLEALVVLDAIARNGSFAAAAEELHRVPSSVTYAIQKLEESLDICLFDRDGHRATLTQAGEALLRGGRNLLAIADNVERSVKRVATGWEAELRIAIGELIPMDKILELCDVFYQHCPETQLRLSSEVMAGTWDSLISGRVDLVIGALGDGPPGGGYALHPLGDVEIVFVVAPDHPLATVEEPIPLEIIRQYRAVAAADSSRGLPPRTVGLLPGQNVLTVPDLAVKHKAQINGMGVGHLPKHFITDDLAACRLVQKQTELGVTARHRLYTAWRTDHGGKALAWFKDYLCDQDLQREWFE